MMKTNSRERGTGCGEAPLGSPGRSPPRQGLGKKEQGPATPRASQTVLLENPRDSTVTCTRGAQSEALGEEEGAAPGHPPTVGEAGAVGTGPPGMGAWRTGPTGTGA